MPFWNSELIANDLKMIVGVIDVENNGPGGEVDTDNLLIKLAGTDEQHLLVRGFDTDKDVFDPAYEEVDMVELTDGLSSKGGLNSHDFRVARAFIDVRQYFINRGFEVVNSLDDYF